MTLSLYGTASPCAGFGSDKARSVIRLRAVESRADRNGADFALVKTPDQLDRAIAANWQSIFVVSDGSIESASTEAFKRLIVVTPKYDYLGDGDVLGVDHSSGKFRTLFRRNSAHNSFLVTERCNNYCLMCSQPPKDVDDRWILPAIRSARACLVEIEALILRAQPLLVRVAHAGALDGVGEDHLGQLPLREVLRQMAMDRVGAQVLSGLKV
jgi:hypothetical protein